MTNAKYAIVLSAPEETPDGRGRLLHAFTTARDLAQSGATVKFFFDGIGVECITAFHAGENPFSEHYVDLFNRVLPFAQACGVCCTHFKADRAAEALGLEMVSFDEHRSLAPLVLDGYQIVNF